MYLLRTNTHYVALSPRAALRYTECCCCCGAYLFSLFTVTLNPEMTQRGRNLFCVLFVCLYCILQTVAMSVFTGKLLRSTPVSKGLTRIQRTFEKKITRNKIFF